MVDPIFIFHLGYKYHLGVAFSHLFQGLEVTDLHGGFAVEFFGCQSH